MQYSLLVLASQQKMLFRCVLRSDQIHSLEANRKATQKGYSSVQDVPPY